MPVRRWGVRWAALWALSCLLCGTTVARAYTVKETESGAIVRWHQPAITLRVDGSVDRYFDGMAAREIVSAAARAWAGLENVPEILINDGPPGPPGFEAGKNANGVYLIEDWELSESSLAVTVATYESGSGKMIDTDILINANHRFSEVPADPEQLRDAYDLPGVLTHEMGHVLGLGESHDDRMATMWPSISRGETHQRDIDEDDVDGAETVYSGTLLMETSAAAGCSGASVAVRRGSTSWAVVMACAALLLLWLWLWRGVSLPRVAPLFGAGVLLFGAPYQPAGDGPDPSERVEIARTLALRHRDAEERSSGLERAMVSSSAQVRMAAAAVLERAGFREDRALAARLAQDRDPEVRRMGRAALKRLESAPPLARISKHDPEAGSRLRRLLGQARRVERGALRRTGAELRRGIIWSCYVLETDAGTASEVEIAGGSMGELTQFITDEDPPPSDGDTVVVSFRERGAPAWAHLRDGVIYGGWLGEGPGIEWDP